MNQFLLRSSFFCGSYILLFFVLFSIALIAYRNCFQIDVPTDSYKLLFSFEKLGAEGLLNNFHDIGMAPFSNSIIFILYKIIGVNHSAWIFFSVLFHSINAFLVFIIGLHLFKKFELKNYFILAFLGALLFLVSPYQTEIVLWAPRMFNYQIAVAFFILGLYFFSHYLFYQKKKFIFLSNISFVLGILSFESPLIFPLASVLFYFFFRIAFKNTFTIKKFLFSVIIPHILIIVGYFVACKIWLGEWILHYGASTHLFFSIPLIVTNYIKYFAKFFLFYRYLPESRSDFLHDVLHIEISNSVTAFILFFLTLGFFAFLFYRLYLKQKNEALFCLMLLLLFCVSLLPVINLDTTFVGAVLSDRYGYLPSVSFFLFVVALLNLLLANFGKYVAGILVILSGSLLSQTIPLWIESDAYCKRLIKNFEPYLSLNKKIYVLNMPDNLNWILTFRGDFREYFSLKYKTDTYDNIVIVSGFFMTNVNDSVVVNKLSDNEYEIKSADGIQRFLVDGIWCKSYETNNYSVNFNANCSSYIFRLKNSDDNPLLMFVAGDTWKRVFPKDVCQNSHSDVKNKVTIHPIILITHLTQK